MQNDELKKYIDKNYSRMDKNERILADELLQRLEAEDTESGFYSTDDFDFDKLCAEIDKLGEEIRVSAPQPPNSDSPSPSGETK